jgi:cell division protein FtsW
MKNWLQKNVKGDPVIWIIVLLLSVISIFVVYSATGTLAFQKMGGDTEAYLRKHGSIMAVSFVVMYISHRIDYRYYAPISKFLLWISVPLLVFTYFFGSTLNAATRTFTIPVIGLSFQTSDLAKLALIAYLANMLAKNQQDIGDIKKTLMPMFGWIGAISFLIILANFSTGAMLILTCLLLLFIGRVPTKYFAYLLGVGAVAAILALSLGQRGKTTGNRLITFAETVMNPKSSKVPFQAQQAYIAIATGGVSGRGIGHSEQRNILPQSYSDFIFAIIVEEYGLLGGAFVVFLYLALLYRGMLAVSQTDRAFGGLLSAGLSFMLVLQAFVNMGVAVGWLPITGQPLPLLSMGGTSLIFTGLAIGIIISVSRGEIQEKLV